LKKYLLLGVLATLVVCVTFTACKKKYPTDTTAAEDDEMAAFAMQDAKTIIDAAVNGQVTAPCASISKRDTNSGTDTLLDINFGPADCMNPNDRRVRRGQILAWYLRGTYFTQSNAVNIAFKNYFVNDIGVAGVVVITNTGMDSAGLHSWNYNASITLTYPSSNATWNSQRS
jgi:hypothetical protein